MSVHSRPHQEFTFPDGLRASDLQPQPQPFISILVVILDVAGV